MSQSSGNTRVLVVEDDPSISLLILAELGQMPCRVSLVENGLMAVRAWLSALESQPFDVVIMDINMPVMSGERALMEIRRLEHDLEEPRIPIVAFSAIDDAAQTQHGLRLGFDAVLAKPSHLGRLTTVIQNLSTQAATSA